MYCRVETKISEDYFCMKDPSKNLCPSVVAKNVMLKFSESQLALMTTEKRRDVARRLASRALILDPDGLTHHDIESLTTEIDPELARAHAHGMRSMKLLRRWTDVALAVGFGFSETKLWAIRALSRNDLSPQKKLSRVEAASVFAIRSAIQ